MTKTRIAFIGIGQHYPSHEWMRRMRSMLDDRIVVCIDDLRNSSRTMVPAPGISYIPRKMSRVKRAMRASWLTRDTNEKFRSEWLVNTIRRSDASHVIVNFLNFATEFCDVWARLDVPVLVHCHGYDVTWDIKSFSDGTFMHPTNYTDLVRALPANVWLIANSTHTREQLLKIGISQRKIFLKRFGVPIAENPRPLNQLAPIRILYLGRLIECKGPLETALAFRLIADKFPDVMLDFAGSGEQEEALIALIAGFNLGPRVKCHGAVNLARGKALREQTSIFTAHNCRGPITGQVEAFGVSLIEAMGEGIPVVTGRSGGIPDFIEHEQNGLLFEPGDIEAHADCIESLISSPQKLYRLGVAAWETVRDRFQPHHEWEDFERILHHATQVTSSPLLAPEPLNRVA